MAKRFGTVPTMGYNGIPQALATAVCTPSVQQPLMVPLQIDWLVYWMAQNQPGSLGVSVDLSGFTNNATLDRIRTVKIDNTYSTVPVSVMFPDTNDVCVCPPQCVVTLPVNTNAHKLVIYADGLQDGFIPYTIVYLFNVALPPSIDQAVQLTFPQWQGSPSIQRSNLLTPGYAPPALGDQMEGKEFDGSVDTFVALWGTPRPSGVIILNSIQNYVTNARTGTARRISVESSGLGGVLFSYSCYIAVPAATQPARQIDFWELYHQAGMNVRLDATESWFLTINTQVAQGLFGSISSFTYVP